MPTRPPGPAHLEQRRRFGGQLVMLRRAIGLSQEQLGERVGVDRRTIGAWEHGTSAPSLDDLTSLGQALGVEAWQLIYV